MNDFENLFFLIPLGIAAFFLYRFFKYGGLAGALLGSRLDDAVGEVELDTPMMKTRIRVHRMETQADREPMVAVVFSSSAKLSASMTPYKMSSSQAQELARLLEKAAQGT